MEVEFGEAFDAAASSVPPVDDDEGHSESELTSEDDLPFDTTKLSSLIGVLEKKGSVRREVKDADADASPFHMLQRLFGPVCERVGKAFNGTVNNYDEVVVKATHVLSTAPTRVFMDLDTRGVGNSEFENEKVYFETCDQPLERTSPTVVVLMNDLAPLRTCDRQALVAQFLTIVHATKDIVASQLDDVAFVMGDDKKIRSRTNVVPWKTALQEEREMIRALLLGDFDKMYKRAFVYEVLAALVSPDLRLRDFTDLILSSEYHVVRAAMDAVNSKKLFICVLSVEYFKAVWLPYMKLYYPRMFSCHSETAASITWEALEVYLPKKKHLIDEIDSRELSAFLKDIFHNECSSEFIQMIKRVDVPDGYSSLTSEFEIHNVRPKRSGIPRKNYNEAKKKKARQ